MPTAEPIHFKVPGLHSQQLEVARSTARHRVLTCGRRWGKTWFLGREALISAAKGMQVGLFYPTYPQLEETWERVKSQALGSLGGGAISRVKGGVDESLHIIRTITGGMIRFYSLVHPDNIRGDPLDLAIMDEASIVPDLRQIWNQVIRPMLTDRQGRSLWGFTPKGKGFTYDLFSRGADAAYPKWAAWRMPTSTNPTISHDELREIQQETPERAWRQEYLAEFLDDGGGYFSGVEKCVDKGRTGPEAPGALLESHGYCMGLDLARKADYTAICILDRTGRQMLTTRIQYPWDRQCQTIIEIARRYQAHVVMDATGVGDVLEGDLQRVAREAGVELSLEPFVFTHASKSTLLDILALQIEQGKLSLLDDPIQRHELDVYAYDYNPRTRRVTSGAPEGCHDDTVMALALAVHGLPRAQPAKIAMTTHRPAATRRNAY